MKINDICSAGYYFVIVVNNRFISVWLCDFFWLLLPYMVFRFWLFVHAWCLSRLCNFFLCVYYFGFMVINFVTVRLGFMVVYVF